MSIFNQNSDQPLFLKHFSSYFYSIYLTGIEYDGWVKRSGVEALPMYKYILLYMVFEVSFNLVGVDWFSACIAIENTGN